MWDYLTMLNERDGGVNGVRLVVEECETQYDTTQGVECYERLKGKNGAPPIAAMRRGVGGSGSGSPPSPPIADFTARVVRCERRARGRRIITPVLERL